MNPFKKYLGAILIIIAAIILICSFFFGWNSINSVQIGSMVIMIAGIVLYIIMNKKSE